MRNVLGVCVCIALLAPSTGALADEIDLTDLSSYHFDTKLGRYVYNYDIPAGSADIVKISFDYDYGGTGNIPFGHAAFRIRRLNADGTDDWLGSFNIHAGSYNLDTDYGPSQSSESLPTGVRHYEFTLNRSNGVWDLALDGTPGVLVGPAAAGGANYFSDESPEAIQNAIDLNYTLPHPFAQWGLGGTGAYRLQFEEALNGTVNNIQITPVPTPAAAWAGLVLLGGLMAWKRMRRA